MRLQGAWARQRCKSESCWVWKCTARPLQKKNWRGGEHTAKSVRCLRDFGRVIVYGNATGQKSTVDPRTLYAKGASVHGLWLTYLSQNPKVMESAWKQLSTWIQQGHLKPIVGHVFL